MRRRQFIKALGLMSVAGQTGASLKAEQAARRPTPAPESPQLAGRAHRVVWGRNGVVAASDQLASLAGVRMLMKGGNAVDAIVAAAAALNVVEPYMSGMGGFGGYMLIYSALAGRVVALDGIGVSPAAATLKNITEADCREGYKASIVPSSLANWAEALTHYGTMSLGDVFEPAIELAERGFAVSKFDAGTLARSAEKLAKYPAAARVFLPNGKPPREGQVLKQPDLARSFRRVALDGPDVFYRGELAQQIVTFLREHGGLLTAEDLARYEPRWRTPISTTFQGYEIYGMPPGSCSMTMFQMLNILEGFDLANMKPYDASFAHLWLEAAKAAFLDDDRYNTGKDVDVPVARLISKEYAAEQRAKIRTTQVSSFPGPALPTEGTTHLSAADRWGNVVSFTQSHVDGFGAGVIAGETGIVMNNGLRVGFVLDPQSVNALAPRQRAKGVMCPTIVVKDGRAMMAVGGAGGYTIPQTVGQVLMKVLTYGFDIQDAIASPRVLINRDGRPPVKDNAQTYLEAGYPEEVATGLKALGHRLAAPGNPGAVQGVFVDLESGAAAGGSDPRRDGHAIAW
jgi:gamma-glutamyltranspeptidase/glutathione hydrolase